MPKQKVRTNNIKKFEPKQLKMIIYKFHITYLEN